MSGPAPADPAELADRGVNPPEAPADTDGFRLAGTPPQVMRLSRKALAGVGVAAAFGLGAALVSALQVPTPKDPENLYRADSHSRPGALTSAPADYVTTPMPGPPHPDDLRRPIVSAEMGGELVPVPPVDTAPAAARTPAGEASERAAEEREAARSSRLFLANAAVAERVTSSKPGISAPASGAQRSDMPVPARRGFLSGGGQEATESDARVRAASSPNILQAGSVIPAALITGIRSDLPGQVTAQVTQNVYDSPTGRILLIPQGARLIGEYDSAIAAGQGRLFLAWDRLILAGGRSIQLGRQPGADAAGMAGLADRTDHHWGKLLRAALISTLLGVGSELGNSRDPIAQAIREGSQDSIGQTGRRLVEREASIPPTLTIRPGSALRVIVTRDLILEPRAEATDR